MGKNYDDCTDDEKRRAVAARKAWYAAFALAGVRARRKTPAEKRQDRIERLRAELAQLEGDGG